MYVLYIIYNYVYYLNNYVYIYIFICLDLPIKYLDVMCTYGLYYKYVCTYNTK